MEVLVDQVRQLTSRLAGWVEAQLVQALDDRRTDMNALRSELQVVLDNQLAVLRAEAAPADAPAAAEALEQRVRSAMARLSESVEGRLADVDQARQVELHALRNELRALADERAAQAEMSGRGVSIANERVAALSAGLGSRLDEVAGQASAASLGVAALRAEVDEGPARVEAFEQRVKAAMGRLTDSVEARLAEAVRARDNDLDSVRSEMANRLAALELVAGRAAEGVSAVELTAVAGADRLDALERQAKAAVARLDDSVDARLAELAAAREVEVQGLRSEWTTIARGLGGRLDAVSLRAAEVADEVAPLRADADAAGARNDELEQRVKAAVGRMVESVEERLAETTQAQAGETEALEARVRAIFADQATEVQAEVEAAAADVRARFGRVHDRIEAVEQQRTELQGAVTTAAAELGARLGAVDERIEATEAVAAEFRARAGHADDRIEAGERQRAELAAALESATADLRARIGQVDDRIEAGERQRAELVAALESAAADLRGRFGHVHQRIEAAEQQQRGVGALVDAKVAEVVERRRAEFDDLRREIEDLLTTQVGEARSDIAVVVSDAHRRFVVSVDQLEERLRTVGELATAAWSAVAGMETMEDTVLSDGRRIEALEIHTHRTDARLGDVVDAKLAELAGERGAELDEIGDKVQRQMRAALDAHLVETRAEVTLALGQGRTELADGAARLVERQAALDAQAAKAVAGLDALGASVEIALAEAEARLGEVVNHRLAELDEVAAEVAEARATTDAAVAALSRKVARSQDQVLKRVAGVTEQVDGMVKAAAVEAGMLAPLRSDVRQLQRQVAELTELLDELRPKRKPPAAKAPARKVPATPAKAPRRRSTT